MQDKQFRYLERFVALLYDTTTTTRNVNEARKHLFTKKERQSDNIPPTKCALQHVKRANYQAGFVWGHCLQRYPELPSPTAFGWEFNATQGSWEPVWSLLPEASKACQELIKCSCNQRCGGRCSCQRAALPCTALRK